MSNREKEKTRGMTDIIIVDHSENIESPVERGCKALSQYWKDKMKIPNTL
jgi:hypothetical protein